MAASDWDPGYELTVTIEGTDYPFKNVTYGLRSKLINRSNSKYHPGYVVQRAGIRSLTFSASGPYKQGEVPLVIGHELQIVYKPASAHVGFSFLGIVESIDHRNDVEDGPTTDVTFQSTDTIDIIYE